MSKSLRLLLIFAAPIAAAPRPALSAQRAEAEERVVLPGNVHPLATPDRDVGPVDPATPLDRMILVLRRPPAAEAALDALLEAQHDPASSDYHRWISPEEFGARFGASDAEIGRVIGWLQDQGLAIDSVARGRGWIDFSGTASQVESAFATRLREFDAAGARHRGNAVDPSVPGAIASVVRGIVSLHDFRRKSSPVAAPQNTDFFGGHCLGPADFARIYGLDPLYQQGIDGTGVKIAVVGRVEIALSDVRSFRSGFGLPANDPSIVVNGPDPGIWNTSEEQEADLDVEWSGGVAPGAQVAFVVSKSTASTDGVDLSAQYIVDHDLADVMTTSFGDCESDLGAAGNAFYTDLWRQAAAQGITSLVSSGDTGYSECDPGNAGHGTGPAVNGLCSPPDAVCVGGTMFDDQAQPSLYWTNPPDPVTRLSVLSYIPETGWNESSGGALARGLWSSGGGPSAVHAKPWWQAGPGIEPGGFRETPDVSVNAGTHDGYSIVQADNGGAAVLGGTSASAPALAGVLALIVQKTGERHGNANPVLYAVAAETPAAFHDVATGNNDVPGVDGFDCGPGYDMVTGVGSPDAFALAQAWHAIAPPAHPGGRTGVSAAEPPTPVPVHRPPGS